MSLSTKRHFEKTKWVWYVSKMEGTWPYWMGTERTTWWWCAEFIDQRGVTGRPRDGPEKPELGTIIESLWGKARIWWTKRPPSDYIPLCISSQSVQSYTTRFPWRSCLRDWCMAKHNEAIFPPTSNKLGSDQRHTRWQQQESISTYALMMSLTSNRWTDQLPFEIAGNTRLHRSPLHFYGNRSLSFRKSLQTRSRGHIRHVRINQSLTSRVVPVTVLQSVKMNNEIVYTYKSKSF